MSSLCDFSHVFSIFGCLSISPKYMSATYFAIIIIMIVDCPHCLVTIEIEELNCKIFRCGIRKSDGVQINPHLDKAECDRLSENNEIYGYGKPFRIDASGNAVMCDYI